MVFFGNFHVVDTTVIFADLPVVYRMNENYFMGVFIELNWEKGGRGIMNERIANDCPHFTSLSLSPNSI